MKHDILIITLAIMMAAPSISAAGEDKSQVKKADQPAQLNDDTKRIADATAIVGEFANMSEGPPRGLAEKAAAVVVIPGLKKAGLGLGGKHGSGVLTVKCGNGCWSDPVFVKMTGGSIGWQAGVSSTDLVLFFMNERSIDGILDGEFTLGGEASVAAGPVGRQGSAGTDLGLDAEIYSYSRSRGLFGGIALDGSKLYIDKDALARVYGGQATAPALAKKPAANDSPGGKLADALRSLASPAEPMKATGTPE